MGIEVFIGNPAVEIIEVSTPTIDLVEVNTAISPKGADGIDGADGKSTYEVAVAAGFVGTEVEFIASLKGADGADGKSAYQLAVGAGFVGTEADWNASLKGEKGDTGDTGDTGPGVAVGGTAGQVLAKIDSTDYNTHWVSPAAGAVSGLTDVTLTSPSNNDVLAYNGTKWVNTSAAPYAAAVSVTSDYTDPASKYLLFATNTSGYRSVRADDSLVYNALTNVISIAGHDVLTTATASAAVIDDATTSTSKGWSSSKVNTALSAKQDTLVSGTNIKTINGNSVLGSGDIAITSGGASIIGEIRQITSATIPYGWLLCDGSAISRSTYALLFAAIGTAYGAGDGSTTFNLPDYRGSISAGANQRTGQTMPVTPSLGDGYAVKIGANSVALAVQEPTGGLGAVVVNFIIAATGAAVFVDSPAVVSSVNALVTGKQDTLVSGTNIKTINGTSVLGSGDLAVLDDTSTTSTTKGWSASKINSTLGDIASALSAIIG